MRPDVIEAGCDEVGRGCLAGPVVAAAVVLPPRFSHPHLDDSKKMSWSKRLELDAYIREKAVTFAIGHCSPAEIDEINILQASFLAMRRAVEQLSPSPAHLLVDGNRFKAIEGLEHTCVIKGDGKFMSIAAASVLAKVHRDRWMAELDTEYPGYGWRRNVGYPTRQHRSAIAELGPCAQHRRSFQLLPRED